MGNNKTEKEVLLDVQHLKKYFEVGKNQTLKAVDDVTLQIYKGETLGLVGRVRMWKIHIWKNSHPSLRADLRNRYL